MCPAALAAEVRFSSSVFCADHEKAVPQAPSMLGEVITEREVEPAAAFNTPYKLIQEHLPHSALSRRRALPFR
jgi:hypothetical protein